MRGVLRTFCAAGIFGLLSVTGVNAQTIEEAEALALATIEVCATDGFEAALQEYSAYVAELVAAGVITEAEALALFQALRDQARAAGCGDAVDALFEELFPDTAFVDGTAPGFAGPGGGGDGGGGGGGDGEGLVIPDEPASRF